MLANNDRLPDECIEILEWMEEHDCELKDEFGEEFVLSSSLLAAFPPSNMESKLRILDNKECVEVRVFSPLWENETWSGWYSPGKHGEKRYGWKQLISTSKGILNEIKRIEEYEAKHPRRQYWPDRTTLVPGIGFIQAFDTQIRITEHGRNTLADQMRETTYPAKSQECDTVQPFTLEVSKDRLSVKLNGELSRLKGESDGDFLLLLYSRRGETIKSTEIERIIGKRPDRIYKQLPPELQELISKPGRGQMGYLMF